MMMPMEKHIERLAKARKWALLGVVGLMPLAMAPRILFQPTNPPKLAILVTGTAIAASLWLLERALGSRIRQPNPVLVPAAAITLPLVVGWAFGLHRGWAFWGHHPRYLGLLPYVAFAVFGLLLGITFRDDKRSLIWVAVGSAALAGGYTVLQAFALEPFVWPDDSKVLGLVRSSSTFGNPNFSGAYFAVMLPLAITLALWDRGRRDIAWVCAGLIGFGLIVSFSQGPWIAGIAGLSIVSASFLRTRFPRARLLAWVAVAGLSVISAGAVIATMVSDAAVERLGSTVESRSWAWESAASMIVERPLAGWGPNVFAAEGIRFRPPEEALVAYWIAEDPHNFLLSQGVSGGILGLAGVVVLAVWVVGRTNRALSRDDHLTIGAGAAAIAYLVQGLVSIDEMGVRLAAWVALVGVAAPLASRGVRDRPPSRRSRQAWAVAALVGIVVAAVSLRWSINSLRAETAALKGYRAAQDNDPEETMRNFENAISLSGLNAYRRLYGTKIGELGTRRAPAGEEYIDEMRDAYSYLSGFPDVNGRVEFGRLLYAWAEKAEDRAVLPEALEQYRAAARLDPHHPLIAVETSDVLRALGRYQEALDLLQSFEDRNPPQAAFYGALALVHAEMGNHSEAERYVSQALTIAEDDGRAALALDVLRSP